MTRLKALLVVATVILSQLSIVWAGEARQLRLVPFPKEATIQTGNFPLQAKTVLQVPKRSAEVLPVLIATELQRAGLPVPEIRPIQSDAICFQWSADANANPLATAFRNGATPEDYALEIRPDAVLAVAPGDAGLFYAAQTLCQVIRANRRDNNLPCLVIRDWPSLRWRCFQDDLTRGPSPTLDQLKFQVGLGAALKMNLFTYYMEYQFAFQKHPKIGPTDGSLQPQELSTLVAFAKPLHLDILGNQQSFGHFGRILRHPEYAPLRETEDVLCPVKEETYQLLDDLYSEVCPLVPFEMFNVCCDETWGLGTGPSKELAQKIGVGGVYVGHIRRIHDLLKEKYNKRMMMWGDIILQHPDKLEQIPKDTVMLTWGYDPRPSFEDQILPFARSGYQFFVCPGMNNWSRILPDFGATTINIRNFVRDGVKHGTIGMLNTSWEDDGEALKGYKWHGSAWGAECAWNASATTPEDFNRRIGAVLFGEKTDHFGQAIELLAQTHRLPGMSGMLNSRFWEDDFQPRATATATRAAAQRLLDLVRPAIAHLESCRNEASLNREMLDPFLLGARRMELIGQRMLDYLEIATLYASAYSGADKQQATALLTKAAAKVRAQRDAHEALGREFKRIWLSESKPYALDWTMDRYAAILARHDRLAGRLTEARDNLQGGKPLPRPDEMGLALPESYSRRTTAQQANSEPLLPEAAWLEPGATHRLGLVACAGSTDRLDLPVEIDVPLPAGLAEKPLRAFVDVASPAPREILGQIDASEVPHRSRLVLVIPGPISKNTSALVHVYLGLSKAPAPLPTAVAAKDGTHGTHVLENDKLRLVLGSEGAHVFRCEVKALGNRDLTMPGESGWAGFSDIALGHRSTPHKLVCSARGPALVRYSCTDTQGMQKTVSLFGGTSWFEVVLAEPTGHYWDFDDPKNFAADGPTPGKYLFSNGASGPVGKQSDGVPAQVAVENVFWGVKFSPQKLALGIATPETAARHVVAPGAGAGGVGIESSPPSCHFVTFAGLLAGEPADTMNRLQHTLDFRNQPQIILHSLQLPTATAKQPAKSVRRPLSVR